MTDVAGYRVLRTIGHGARTRLVLGFADGRTSVLKIGDARDDRVRVEMAALTRAAGDHVVGLEDVSLDEHEAVLVLERLRPGSLGELLEVRGSLDPGEAVTILAPIALALERLHAAGVAHGALALGAVCFRDDGAPTLVGFGSAELFAPGAPQVVLETIPGVLADRVALRGLCEVVLGRVPGSELARRVSAGFGAGSPASIASALFAVAAATEVRFEAEGEAEAGDALAVAPRVVGLGEPVEEPVAAPPLPSWLGGLLPHELRTAVDAVRARGRAMWAGWDRRRRRLVVGGTVGALVVVLALAAVPTTPRPAGSAPADSLRGGSPAVDVASPGATSGAGSSETSDLPGDPLDAAAVLLDLRQRCIRDLSVLCLDDVDQPGSSGLAVDRATIAAILAGGEYPGDRIRAGDLVLVEQLGDSVLIALPGGSDPGSILLMKTTEGWRIRDYLTKPPHTEVPGASTND